MTGKRTIRKPTAREVGAIKSRVRHLVSREIGQTSIVKDKMKEQEYNFIYPIDEIRSLAFKITVSPVMNKASGTMFHMVVNPGAPPQ